MLFVNKRANPSGALAEIIATLCCLFALSAHAAPPVYDGSIGPVGLPEDGATMLDVSPAFSGSGVFGLIVDYTVTAVTPGGLVVITQAGPRGELLTFTGEPDQNGPFTYDLRVTNLGGEFTDVTLNGGVAPRPDAPVLAVPLANLSVDEDEPSIASVDLDLHFTDVDGDTLGYRINTQSDPSVIDVSVSGNLLTFTALPDAFGDNTVEVCADDGTPTDEACGSMLIQVAPINDPTTVGTGITDVTVNEDESPIPLISLAPVFIDVDDPSLTYSVALAPTGIINAAIVSGNQLQLSTITDINGDTTVTVTAGDGKGPDVSVDFDVDVLPVNDAPTQDSVISPVTVVEDQASIPDIDLSNHFSDIDGDSLSYSITSPPSAVIDASISSENLTFTAIPDANGSDVITVSVTDGNSPPITVDITVNVTPEDDPPTNTGSPPTLTVDEDQTSPLPTFDLSTIYSDVDTPSLTYTITAITPSDVINASVSGSILSLSLIPDANGTAAITVEVTDGTSPAPSVDVPVVVNPINDAPVHTPSFPNLVVAEDQVTVPPIDLDNFFSDVDGDALGYTFTNLPAGVIDASLSGSILSFATIPDVFGNATIEVTASDGSAPPVTGTLAVEVQAQNDAPTKPGAIGTVVVDEDQVAPLPTFDLNSIYADIDGPGLSYTIVSVVPNTIITPLISGSILSFTQVPNAFGTVTIVIDATDGIDPGPPETVTVVVNPTNDEPTVVAPLGSISIDEDEAAIAPIDLLPVFQDIDGDSLTYSVASVSPADMITAAVTGSTLQLTSNPDRHGTATIIIEAIDGGTVAAQDTLTVNIAPIQDPPEVIAPIADQVVDEDGSIPFITLTAVFGDVKDGDPLTFAVIGNSPAGVINADINSGELRLLTIPNVHGSATVTVEATDTAGLTVTDELVVTVNSINDAPIVLVPTPATLEEDTAGTQTADATAWFDDVDLPLDTHTYALVAVTGDPVFDAVSVSAAGIVTYTLALNESGIGFIEVSLTDQGGITVSATFRVVVNAVNDPPYVLSPPGTLTALEDEGTPSFSMVGVFGDDDIGFTGDVLTYTVTSNPTTPLGTLSVSGDNVILSQLPNENGTITVEVTASDIDGETAAVTFDIDITPVNDAPFQNAVTPDVIQIDEDAPPTPFPVMAYFDDVDLSREGDSFSYALVGGTPSPLFDSITVVGSDLVLDPAANAVGLHTVQVRAIDAGGLQSPPVNVPLEVLLVIAIAEDDTATTTEGQSILIDVMANDTEGDPVTEIISAGATVDLGDGGIFEDVSESDPTVIVNSAGVGLLEPNGRVDIESGQIRYTPKDNFSGTDFFHYTIQDGDGDTSTARVDVTITDVNQAPESTTPPRFDIFQGQSLSVLAEGGLADFAFDADGDPLTVLYLTVPDPASYNAGGYSNNPDGSFTFTPRADYSGLVTFDIQYQDPSLEVSGVVTVEIDVAPTPPPPAAPPAGEVEFDMNLSDVPLEDAIATEANVLVVMDDSGSMDWDMMTDQSSGVFRLHNGGGIRSSGIRYRSTWYYYIYDLPTNVYNRPVAPTQDNLDANVGGYWTGNNYGVWRLRSSQYSTIYYNPEIEYLPWRGLDRNNNDFTDAPPNAAPLDPFDNTTQTIDLTSETHSFNSSSVPVTRNHNNGRRTLNNVNVYYPYYYTTTATGRPAWNSPHTKVEIKPGNPLDPTRTDFPGSPSRLDCAVDDGDPLTCSYAVELQNFANWFTYYRTREYTAKAALGRAVADATNLRMGYAVLNDSNDREPIDTLNSSFRTGHKSELLEQIYSTNSGGGTPLRRALARAGRHFECVSGDSFGSSGTTSPGSPACPVLPLPEGQCQNNFTLLFSDGTWNGSNSSVPSVERQDHDGNGSGSGAVNTVFDGGVFADGRANTLADIAMYYYERDLHPGIPDGVPTNARDLTLAPAGSFLNEDELMHQHMKTYTVGFGVTGNVELDDLPNTGVNPDTGEPVIDFTQPFSWGNPFNNNAAKIDDMLHAALNGRGQFLQANNPVLLAQAFQDAFEEFADGSVSVSAVAFGSTRLRKGTVEYRGFFNLKFNSGDLEAIELLDPVTGLPPADPIKWSAATQLLSIAPTDRRIFTYDRIAQDGRPFRHASLNADQQAMLSAIEVDYLRGVRTFEEPAGPFRAREGVLGDIVNSGPKAVGRPEGIRRDRAPFPTDKLYSDFVEDNKNRRRVVYVGANDGMLHAFDAGFQNVTPIDNGTGNEMFAFVPNKLIDSSQRFNNDLDQLTSLVYSHKYFVDLTPTVEDVFMKPNGSGTKDWRTLLVGGLRGGGKGYFALDITDPDLMAVSETAAANSVLWEFTDEDDTYPVDLMGVPEGGAVGARTDALGLPVKDLGYTYSEARIAMTNVDGTGSPARKKWAAIFGNGYNSTAGIAKLFVLFIDDGVDGWQNGDFIKVNTGQGTITTDPSDPASNDPMAGIPNGLGQPTLIDKDLDGVVDLAYAGDLHGNLYRFEIGDANPVNWKAVKLFTATYDGTTQTRQSITTAPVVTKLPDREGFIISFGTGSFVTEQDGLSTDIQSVYGIWDRFEISPATAAPATKNSLLTEQEITNVADETFPDNTLRIMSKNEVNYIPLGSGAVNYGWYIDLDPVRPLTTVQGNPNPDTGGLAPPSPQYPGERAIRRIVKRANSLVLTSVIPRDANSCFRAPPGAIWFVDALSGGDPGRPIIDLDNDGSIDDGDFITIAGEDYAAGILFDSGSGDGSLVDPSVLLGDGDSDYLVINKSHGEDPQIVRIIKDGNRKTGRLSWWELLDE